METSAQTARIPQVDKVLRHHRLVELQTTVRRDIIASLVRQKLDKCRADLASGTSVPELESIVNSVVEAAASLMAPRLHRLINATGIILNTNLGRAPLSESILQRAIDVAAGYCNLEFDLATGKRGERARGIETLLQLLTGCEAALVVNNNAAAVLLAVSTFAHDRQVIVSRGELIEIGGSFRLPDVIMAAGGDLVEVGTTNRTRLADFRQAVNENTGLFLRCHRSNFAVVGFTEEVCLPDLVSMSAETGVPVLEDLGSGALIDLENLGFAGEPTVSSQLKAGADLVTFSGDKLLGGPQAGIIVGKKKAVERLHKNPLYRALRPDKLTLSTLETLLCQYLSPNAECMIPALNMARTSVDELRARAEAICVKANASCRHIKCVIIETESAAGGGSLPGKTMPSYGVALAGKMPPNQMTRYLRSGHVPVVAVVHEERVILDLRTVLPHEEAILLEAIKKLDQKIC